MIEYKMAVDYFTNEMNINLRKHIFSNEIQEEQQYFGLAVKALKEKIERESSDSLTLNEIKERNGEPIWLSKLTARKNKGYYAIYSETRITSQSLNIFCFTSPHGLFERLFEMDYGKTWLAYRNRPIE